MRDLGISFTKYMQYLYTKNYETVLGEQKKEDINKWRAIPCS